jgi:hypothetical protein
LPNRNFQGFNNVATNCYWALVVILSFFTSSLTFL